MPVRIGIDTGGTFTDLIGVDEATNRLVIAKTPSTPRRPVEAVINAIETSGVAGEAIAALSIGTTVATNANRLMIKYQNSSDPCCDPHSAVKRKKVGVLGSVTCQT